MFPKTLEQAADHLGEIFDEVSQASTIGNLLELAMLGAIRLKVMLPATFTYVSKNGVSYRPRFPEGFVLCIGGRERPYRAKPLPTLPQGLHFTICQRTAYRLRIHHGKSVGLMSVLNINPDGEIDEFHANPGEPHLQISIADLRIDEDELERLILKMKASSASEMSEQAPASPADQAMDGPILNAQPPASQGADDAASDDTFAPWVVKAHQLALAYIKRHKDQGLTPSQDDVCGHLEARMRESKIFGHHKRPLNKGYIKRNAIQGAWWRANRP